VVGGLLVTGILTAFVLPNATNRWSFGIEGFAVGLSGVEGAFDTLANPGDHAKIIIEPASSAAGA
jgi:hypothetical protein